MREEIRQSLVNYADFRVPTGGFLRAVLENNLKEAFMRADEDNTRDMKEIVAYCYWELPSICWGSKEKVNAWLEGGA